MEIWDRVLERVGEPTAAAPRRAPGKAFWRLAFAGTGSLAAVFGIWALFCRPTTDHFTARGDSRSKDAHFEVGCPSSGRAVCRTGETLMFTVNAALTSGYVGAYAERLDNPSSAPIWYFPNSGGASPLVPPGTSTIVLPEGVRIGPEQPPGRYRVTIWTSPEPIGPREVEIARADPANRSHRELEVVP